MNNKKIRILILTSESWNDFVFGNGVLTNWFTDFNADFAQIYLSPILPHNNICNLYFQITDKQMLKSFWGKRAGKIVKQDKTINKMTSMHQGIYVYLKKISTYIHSPMMILNDFIWSCGHYDKSALKNFIDDFQPDVIFSPRMGSVKLFRLERIVSEITSVPIVAFTGDNEIGYDVVSYSPLYWLRRWYTNRMFLRNCKIYNYYFMHSQEQADIYSKKYRMPTSTLFKCATDLENNHIKYVNFPIVMVYAGRLYCNRWKTLAEIGKALKIINKDGIRMQLDIYTGDELTRKQRASLCVDNSIHVHNAVTPSELINIYNQADIALHVESFDKEYMYVTKYSFSTKIIDLLASGCAIMAICWEKHAGYQYLHSQDAAFCCPDYNSILPLLFRICETPSLISEYQKKASECKKNHSRTKIHKQLLDVFEKVINDKL